jgi:hypothetical protein
MPLTARMAWLAAAALLAVAGLSPPARGQQPAGNAAIEWNAIASTAVMAPPPQGAGQPPHVAVLSLAMVQGAVYDAVNAIDGGHQPYVVAPPTISGDSKEAAAATAAFRALVGFPDRTPPLAGLFPAQLSTLQPLYDASLANVPDGPSKTGGIAIGEAAAAAMLTARQNDGRGGSFVFVPGTDPGEWRLAPPQGPTGIVARDPAAWVGFVRPFLVPNVEMLRTDGPNALTSAAYSDDFNEVKEIGSLTSTKRTADQTAAAIFWQDSGPAIWNRVYRALATSHGLDIVDSARLFAITNLAAADGSIGCWNDKAYWSFWRPITAIREAATDGNPATEADSNWVPLFDPSVPVSGAPLVTPGFPDHPAGHTCISGATVYALQAFFGTDRVPFTAISNKCSPAPCPARSFDRFSEALKEIIDARVWGGIHFRTADVQGAVLGKKVAHYMEKHYFQPTG